MSEILKRFTVNKIIFLILLLSYSSAFSMPSVVFTEKEQEDGRLQLFAAIDTGVMNGKIYEYVYSSNRTVSRLEWNLPSVYYTGFTLSGVYRRLSVSIGYREGFTFTPGIMENYDWMSSAETVSHYSRHENFLETASFSEVSFGYTFIHRNNMSLRGLAGFQYSIIKMSARDGYREYPPGSERQLSYGKVIVYEQIYSIPYIGASYIRRWNDGWGFSASLKVSMLTSCDAVDNHLRRGEEGIDFYDSIRFAPYMHTEAGIFFYFTESTRLVLTPAFTYIPEWSGDSYNVDRATGEKSSIYHNGAGIKYRAWQIGISISHALL